jgi:hypothetical protein
MANMRYEDLFLTKASCWSYEHEWRVLRRLDRADKVVDGGAVHLFEFPPEVINEVVLGACATAETDGRAIRAAQALGPHVRVTRATLHGSQYALEFRPLLESHP